jgi:hypothetical protein
MAETVELFRVLFASPSDVTEELPVISEVVQDWNIQHGDRAKVRLELVNWRTHSHPEAGGRPQALINRQFADRADIVIAVFWKRLGSPTGKADSGTIEEVQRALKRRKKVMIYFSERGGPKDTPSDAKKQAAKIAQHKKKIGQSALYGTYRDMKAFEADARRDLALVMHEVISSRKENRKR